MTTFEPGARLVLTHGLVARPRSTAFLASRPAATITEGFEVLVQLVIAAMTTEPSRSVGRALDDIDSLGHGGRGPLPRSAASPQRLPSFDGALAFIRLELARGTWP